LGGERRGEGGPCLIFLISSLCRHRGGEKGSGLYKTSAGRGKKKGKRFLRKGGNDREVNKNFSNEDEGKKGRKS